MTAEEIVRALAAQRDPHCQDAGWLGCIFCEETYYGAPNYHAPDCPWRQAQEWVTARA